jgi:allantoinase
MARADLPPDLLVRGRRVLTPEGTTAATVGVRDGRVLFVDPLDSDSAASLDGVPTVEIVELADDEVLLPGLVDTHVHVNDPGRTDWEGFPSATAAAAAGGVTTIVDMPLNSIPPTIDRDALDVKLEVAARGVWVDVGFWGGAVPGNVSRLRALHVAGVFGFKCFLLPSGVDEFPHLDDADLESAMREIASFGGLLVVHAEDAATIAAAPSGHSPRYQDFLASRPAAAEVRAVARAIEVARHTGCRLHVVHLSSAESVPLVRAARESGADITVETCPHYLCLTAEEVGDGQTQFKCCPPIREAANRDLLWAALADGTVDLVVTDHSPSTVSLKRLDSGDFADAWGGISSLQLGLPAVWTQARERGVPLTEVVRWMSAAPAARAGLRTKGRLEVGADADFSVFAPEDSFVVDPGRLHHRNPVTPYAGRRLHGVVRATWLRGMRVDLAGVPRGRILSRGDT